MRIVEIDQLRSELSECVRAAREGETLLISDHDDIVAELGPVRERSHDHYESVVAELAVQGQVTRAAASKQPWTWHSPALGLPAEKAQRMLEELREDR